MITIRKGIKILYMNGQVLEIYCLNCYFIIRAELDSLGSQLNLSKLTHASQQVVSLDP
jgi:hypothetical protein